MKIKCNLTKCVVLNFVGSYTFRVVPSNSNTYDESRAYLRYHILQTHGTPVRCEICAKIISNQSQLMRHKVFAHNQTEGVWLCEKCPKSAFFHKSTYENHVKEKHQKM